MAAGLLQLRLLIWKNVLQMRRNLKSTLFELGIPMLMIYVVVVMYSENEATHKDVPEHLNDNMRDLVPSIHLLPFILQQAGLKFAIAPDNQVTREFIEHTDRLYPGSERLQIPKFSQVVEYFDDSAAMDRYIEHGTIVNGTVEYTNNIFAGLVIEKKKTDGWKAVIRMNATDVKPAQEEDNPLAALAGADQEGPHDKILYQIVHLPKHALDVRAPGFVSIQIMVQKFINAVTSSSPAPSHAYSKETMCSWLHHLLDSAQLEWEDLISDDGAKCEDIIPVDFFASQAYEPQAVAAVLFPIPKHTEYNDPMETSVITYLIYIWVLPLVRLVRGIVVEKETKAREGMLMMGMHLTTVYLSWILTYVMMGVLIAIAAVVQFDGVLFTSTSAALVFAYFMLFDLSILAFGFVVSTLFDRSKSATASTPLLLLALTAPYIPHQMQASGSVIRSPLLLLLKHLTPFSTTTHFALGLRTIFNLDHMEGHVGWDTLDRSADGGISIYAAMTGMLFNAIFYVILGWYLDHVLPKEYGVRYPWNFIFKPSFWRFKRPLTDAERQEHQNLLNDGESKSQDQEDDTMEPLSIELKRKVASEKCISIENLGKTFGSEKVAVKNLSLTMCEGEIFGLLGSNGAGKTTTISMLSGLLPPSNGTARIYGRDISQDMDTIRTSLGVCPQHDVLFEKLTVKEHLVLFGRLKGISSVEIQTQVDNKLVEVGLTEKKDCFATELSGGQKRKLSVAIALIGGSKVVFLDEPTSGMDPYSRRFTWNILQNNREGRIMILTTHAMDEADILSDRIGIMAHGQLQCCGSSQFLKSKYGVGYNLTIVKRSSNASEMIQLIEKYIPDMTILTDIAGELSVRLPTASTPHFQTLFQEFDAKKQELGIHSYGVSVTTVEEVFLKVVSDQYMDDAQAPSTKTKVVNEALDSLDVRHQEASKRVQFRALFMKRAKYTLRDKRSFLSQYLMPLAFLFIMLRSTSSITNEGTDTFLDIVTEWENTQSVLPYTYDHESAAPHIHAIMTEIPKLVSIVEPLEYVNASLLQVVKDTVVARVETEDPDDPDTEEEEEEEHSKFVRGFAEYLVRTAKSHEYPAFGAVGAETSVLQDTTLYNVWHNDTMPDSLVLTIKALHSAICSETSTDINACRLELHAKPLPGTAEMSHAIHNVVGFMTAISVMIAMATITSTFANFVVKEREVSAKHLQLLSGVSIPAYWLANLAWDLIVYSCAAFLVILMLIYFDIQVLVSSDHFIPLVNCFVLYGFSVIAFMYVLSFCFSSHSSAQSYLSYLNTTQVFVMGITYTMSMIPGLCTKIAPFELLFQFFPGYSFGIALLRLATIEMTWWRSHCASGNGSMDELMEMFDSFMGKKTPSMTFGPYDTAVTGESICALLGTTIFYLSLTILIDILSSTPAVGKVLMDWSMRLSWNKKDRDSLNSATFSHDESTDVDVTTERDRIEQDNSTVVVDGSTGDSEDVVVLNQIGKVYRGGKMAVKDLSFGIRKGECFGFLGVNGAGKSTTIKILTGGVLPTRGEAWIGGQNVLKDQIKARKLIGYCPQENALLDLLTVREHLQLFALLKGVSESVVSKIVAKTIVEMDLVEFEHVNASKLSGGNKRKLSVGIALIGNPPIVFLDEPSTGVDPLSRRFMWDVITRVSTQRKDCSIILTTHSMEEAQAVCSLASIMVDGELKCWGTIQHLKHRYGKGLLCEFKLSRPSPSLIQKLVDQIEIRSLSRAQVEDVCRMLGVPERMDLIQPHGTGWVLDSTLRETNELKVDIFAEWWLIQNNANELDEFFHQTFTGARQLEQHGSYYRYELPFDTDRMPLGEIFGTIEAAKDRLAIKEYSVSQPSLEQIFNQFASTQSQDSRPEQVNT